LNLKEKINFAVDSLNERLIERDQLIRLTILALFSKSHMFLIGERGVAKSLTIRLLNNLIEKAKYWELQVGVDTEVKQLFGEKQVNENGTVYYKVVNTLLEAHIVFLDEMFKAKSELLNMLLQIMADKYYTTGDGRNIEVPLLSLIGASNEYPSGKLAEPYLDRMLFWYDVNRIKTRKNRLKFFIGDFDKTPIEAPIFTLDEIDDVYENSQNDIIFPDNVLERFNNIIDMLIIQEVKTSDRKYFNTIKAMKVSAYINSRKEIDYSDIFFLLFTAWHNDVERDKVNDVLLFEMFLSSTQLETYIIDIKTKYEEIDNYVKGDFYNCLNYLSDFNGANASSIYDGYLNSIKICRTRYSDMYDELMEVKQKINSIIDVEKLIENNLFLSEIKNSSVTQKLDDSIENLESDIVMEFKILDKWILDNNSLLHYNEMKSKNIR